MPDDSEAPIREFADRGVIWLLELPQNLRDVVHLLAAEIAERLDFSKAERFNRSFVPNDLNKQEVDLLYRVPYRDDSGEILVYVLLEHQSSPDDTMGLRLLGYMLQIWQLEVRRWQDTKTPRSQRKLSPILPLVLYTGRRAWKQPIGLSSIMDAPDLFARFVPQWDTLFLNLHATPGDLLAEANSAVADVLLALQAADQPQEVLASVLQKVVIHLDNLPRAEQAQWSKAMLFLYLLVRHKREVDEQDVLSDIMNKAVTSHARELEEIKEMTGAQALLNQGREEGLVAGREEGREEGRVEGRRQLLLDQLQFKFGDLPQAAISLVQLAVDSEIEAMSMRVLTAATLKEVTL